MNDYDQKVAAEDAATETARQFAEEAIGACAVGTLNERYTELIEDLTMAEALDNELFICAACGWFCGVDELSEIEDDQVCEDCECDWKAGA